MNIPKSAPVRISIRSKLLIYILLTATVIFITTLGYIVSNTNKNAIEDAHKYVVATSQQYANAVKATLDNDIAICRSLANAFSGYKDISSKQRYNIYNQIMKNTLINNPQFKSIWTSWELNAIDPNFTEINGRDRYMYYRKGNEIRFTDETIEVGETNLGGTYYDIKGNPREVLTDPYYDTYIDQQGVQLLMSSIAIPLLDNGIFVGLTGADIEMGRFYDVISNIVPFTGSYAIMISGSGQIIAHPDNNLINTSILDTELGKHSSVNLGNKLKTGDSFSYSEDAEGLFISFAPFNPGTSNETWFIIIVVPSDIILLKAENTFKISVIVGFFGILILALLIWFIARSITSPLIKTTKILNQLSTGDIKDLEVFNINTHDELAEMAKALQTLSNSLKTNADFAINIGEGNLTQSYNPLSKDDILGNALIHMRKNLLDLRGVNEKNRWMQTSLVRISELLQGEKSISDLGNQILAALAEILDIQIASIFFNDNGELILSSSYSYNVRKSNLNRFKFGEGLIG